MGDTAVGVNPNDDFPQTHWTLVAQASGKGVRSRDAMAHFVKDYWYPIYSFIRQRTGDKEKARDATQAFFAHLLEKQTLAKADRTSGKFRTFLLACCANFLNSDYRKQQAERAGGGVKHLSLDFDSAETKYLRELNPSADPVAAFKRSWGLEVLNRTTAILEKKYMAAGKLALFRAISRKLTNSDTAKRHEEIGVEFGLPAEAIKSQAKRLKQDFRDTLREVVGLTVMSPGQIDEELRELMEAIAVR